MKRLVIFVIAMMASLPTYGAFTFNPDVDADGEVEALTDGILVIRYYFGFRGAALVTGAVDLAHCGRCDAPAIETYLASLGSKLDVDGNGDVEPLTDGLLVLRYFFGFRGAILVDGTIDDGCTHCSIGEIEAYLAGVGANDDVIHINDPLHNNGLTLFPLRPLGNDLVALPDAVEIVSVTQPVIDFCDPVNWIGYQAGSHGPTCWRQIGVVSINPDLRSATLDLNPGVLPTWNPQWPYDGTKPPKADACGHGTIEDNEATLGTAANPALFCMTSNSSPWPSLAYMPEYTGWPAQPPCDYAQPQPWDIPFEYTISDGEHQSTATVTLKMYTPPCIYLPNWVPNLLGGPPPGPPPPPLPQPNPLTHAITIAPPLPPDAPPGTPPPTVGPTLTLDTSVIASNLDPSTISGWNQPAVTLTLPATCPQIPNVVFLSCDVTGKVAMDPGAEFIYDPNGVVVQLTDPLNVVNGDNSWRSFVSVEITSVLTCEECAIKRYWGTLFGGATPSCYLSVNGMKCSADCVTGELFPDLPGQSTGCHPA